MLILYGFMFLSSLILVNPLKTMPELSFDVPKIQQAKDVAFQDNMSWSQAALLGNLAFALMLKPKLAFSQKPKHLSPETAWI